VTPVRPAQSFLLGLWAGFAEFIAGRYEWRLAWLLKARRDHPGHLAAHRNLAACFAQLGRIEEAKGRRLGICWHVSRVFRISAIRVEVSVAAPRRSRTIDLGGFRAGRFAGITRFCPHGCVSGRVCHVTM